MEYKDCIFFFVFLVLGPIITGILTRAMYLSINKGERDSLTEDQVGEVVCRTIIWPIGLIMTCITLISDWLVKDKVVKTTKRCVICGELNRDDCVYCDKCGNKFGSEEIIK